MRRLIIGAAALLALSPFIALASASTPAGAAVTHPAASAANASDAICTNSNVAICIVDNGNPVSLGGPPDTFFKTPFGMCTTSGGESYCEVRESGTETCLQWNDNTDNTVSGASCDRSNANQLWWWSGQRFRNLGATQQGEDACMNQKTSNESVDVYVCSGTSSEWSLQP
jgi:hypothetical protein